MVDEGRAIVQDPVVIGDLYLSTFHLEFNPQPRLLNGLLKHVQGLDLFGRQRLIHFVMSNFDVEPDKAA